MELRNNDALGAVDDERTVVGHQGELAEENLLLAHVLDRLLGTGGFLIENDEAHFHTQWGRVRESTQLALFDIEYGLAETVAHVLERGVPRVARDREHALECSVQPDLVARLFRLVRLQERAIGVELNGEQVGRIQNGRLLAEILADALLLGKGISHRVTSKRITKQWARETSNQSRQKHPPDAKEPPRSCDRGGYLRQTRG